MGTATASVPVEILMTEAAAAESATEEEKASHLASEGDEVARTATTEEVK